MRPFPKKIKPFQLFRDNCVIRGADHRHVFVDEVIYFDNDASIQVYEFFAAAVQMLELSKKPLFSLQKKGYGDGLINSCEIPIWYEARLRCMYEKDILAKRDPETIDIFGDENRYAYLGEQRVSNPDWVEGA
jgi:hypothetical protein